MQPELPESSPESTQGREVPSEHIEMMDLLSYIYLRHGLPDKAAVLLAARHELEPDDPKTLLSLAVAQVRSAKPERALVTLEQLAMLGALDASFHLLRAQAFHALGQTEESFSAMRTHVALRAREIEAAKLHQTVKTTVGTKVN